MPRASGCWSFDLHPGARISARIFDTSYPIVDGHVLKKNLLEALLFGTAIDVPMLVSNTGNEASGLPHIGTVVDYRTYIHEAFPSHAAEVFALYPAETDMQARHASWNLISDQTFSWSSWTAARLQARNLSSPSWYYQFLRAPPIPSDTAEATYAKAFHAADTIYAFGNLHMRPWDWTEGDHALSEQLKRAWLNFAHTGRPDDDGAWPSMSADNYIVKVWDVEPRLENTGPAPERMAFWDRYHGVERAL